MLSSSGKHRYLRLGALVCLSALVVLFAGGASPSRRATGAGRHSGAVSGALTILYDGRKDAQVRSCNCTMYQFGGLGRESTFVTGVRKAARNVAYIECGNMLTADTSGDSGLKMELMMNSVDLLGYDVAVPGEAELLFAQPDLEMTKSYRDLVQASKTPFVLANVTDLKKNAPFLPKKYSIITTKGGIRVAVIGFVASNPEPTLSYPDAGLAVNDPAPILKRTLPEIRKKADFVIATTTSRDDGDRIAAVAGVDLVIVTDLGAEKFTPPRGVFVKDVPPLRKSGKCLIVDCYTRNDWSVGRLDLLLGKGMPVVKSHKLFFLGRQYAEDPRLIKLFDTMYKKEESLAEKQQHQLRLALEANWRRNGVDPALWKPKSAYAGTDKCKSCHAGAYDAWKKSRHARALESLKKTGRQNDRDCIGCHVTGAFRSDGYVSAKETPNLGGVQCEVCHGPGIRHAQEPSKVKCSVIKEVVCRGCHNHEYNPDFNFDKMYARIKH